MPDAFSCDTGCIDATLGELAALALACACSGAPLMLGVVEGGGGNGAIPTLFAAAAAALAYFKPSPASLGGATAGFILALAEDPLLRVGSGVLWCTVASVGSGDLSCVDGRRMTVAATASTAVRCLAKGALGFVSASGITSSCIDWVSCEDTLSFSWFMPYWSSSSSRLRSSYMVSSSMKSSFMPSDT